MWRRAPGLLLWMAVSLVWGETVPGRFIVQLTAEPDNAVKVVAKGSPVAPRAARALPGEDLESQQVIARRAVESSGWRVNAQLRVVTNALVVEAPGARIEDLESLPGVKRVVPVELMEIHLDRAVIVNQVARAWDLAGGVDKAGKGVKIAILDTGIEASHPGFKDESMSSPEGYPQVSDEVNRGFTSGKIIVARAYETSNPSVADQYGHGTAVAMVAAGVGHSSPRGWMSGVAPKAWLGIYRINQAGSGTIPSDYTLRALEDAIVDGMQVINMSFGSETQTAASVSEMWREVFNRAKASGITIVVSAGNAGPGPMSLSRTGSLDEVISVGANENDRTITTPGIFLEEGDYFPAVPSASTGRMVPITAPAISDKKWGGDGRFCEIASETPAAGLVVFIAAGGCESAQKVRNAELAGAVAAILTSSESDGLPVSWNTEGSTLNAWMVSWSSGQSIAQEIESAGSIQVTLTPREIPLNPDRIGSFSARGPTADLGLKPDVTAVGLRMYTAAQTTNPRVGLYNASGYLITQGTSFSSPMVAGAAAVLKAARPGLQEDDYRSLLVNSARAIPQGTVQTFGAGSLSVSSGMLSAVTVNPVSVSFGISRSSFDTYRQFRFTNLMENPQTVTLTVTSSDATVPIVDRTELVLDPKGSGWASLMLQADGPAPGEYQGVVEVRANSEVVAHIPYWFAVPLAQPSRINVAGVPTLGLAGSRLKMVFHVQDATGVPLDEPVPQVTTEFPGASVVSVERDLSTYPGAWIAEVQLAAEVGVQSEFRITAGDVSYVHRVRGI